MDVLGRFFLAAFCALEFHFMRFRWRWLMTGAVLLLVVGGYLTCAAPRYSSSESLVTIMRGASANEIARQLADAHIIRNSFALRMLLRINSADDSVQAGVYRFASPQNIFTVTRRLLAADYGLPPVRITFPEGITVRDMAAYIAHAFPHLLAQDFLIVGQSSEGYLFPDTYFFPPSSTVEAIQTTLRKTFNAKIAPLSGEITLSGHSLADVVTMASLVEKEARTSENRRIVADILWNRLARGMPLQVDAVFGYIYGRDTYSPSLADLKVDSPYNTYTHKGLPPGPINNPGLDSLEAVLNPTKTNYVYYLTGKDNLMHYATTYAEHQVNHRKYLD